MFVLENLAIIAGFLTLLLAATALFAAAKIRLAMVELETLMIKYHNELMDEITECKRLISKNRYQNNFNKRTNNETKISY